MRCAIRMAFALMAAGIRPPTAFAAADAPMLADRIAAVLPSVVSIKTVTARGGAPYYYWASGFIVASSGMIVTNRHVIAGAEKITVTGRNLPTLQAKVVYVSSMLDLAIVKIDAGRDLPVLSFADSDRLQVGDPVLAIGNALGIGLSVSAGIVSALHRHIEETLYDDFIQTDAAINHGSSGGPLVNPTGQVVGVDTALDSSPNNTGSIGIGFAMPANDVKFVVDQVLRFGRERAGWLGLQLQRVTEDLADGFAIGAPRGVLVADVAQTGPAGDGHVRVGDIILGIAGQAARGAQQVQRIIAETPVGQTVPVTLLRDGVTQTIPLTIAEYPPDEKAAAPPTRPLRARISFASAGHLGMRLAAMTSASRKQHELAAGQEGVLVTVVDPFSAARDRGITAGNVILQVGQNPVATPAEVLRRLGISAGRRPTTRRCSFSARAVRTGSPCRFAPRNRP